MNDDLKNNDLQNAKSVNEVDAVVDGEAEREMEYAEFRQVLADINAELLSENDIQQSLEQSVEESVEKAVEDSSIESTAKNNELTVLSNEEQNNAATEGLEDPAVAKQYKEYRLNKICSKINYDLANPTLTTALLKQMIADALKYNLNAYMLLTSKVKGIKRYFKGKLPIGAVIGSSESTLLAKLVEIKQAKWQGVKEIELLIPLSLIKEGKKKAIIKQLSKCRKCAGKKIDFKVAIDGMVLTSDEYALAIECAIKSKAKRIVLKNCDMLGSIHLLTLAKSCARKCEIEVQGCLKTVNSFTEYTERGVDYFALNNPIAFIASVRLDD